MRTCKCAQNQNIGKWHIEELIIITIPKKKRLEKKEVASCNLSKVVNIQIY